MNYEIDLQGSKVLLVDDNPHNLTLLGAFLKKFNFKLAISLDGQSAYDTAIKFEPDLILMDINMPVLNGFEATKLLKANKKTEAIPVIFTTALADTDNIIKGYEIGGVDYVIKPFKLEELYQRVKAHLQIKKLIDKVQETNLELHKVNKSKDKFFSIISHDLRGPFTASLGITELMINYSQRISKEEMIDYVFMLNDSLKNQFNLLEKLLDWSRVQNGSIEFRPTKLTISSIINNVTQTFKSNLINKNINFIIDYNDLDIDNLFIIGDEFMVNSALSNILSNAIKFTKKNGTINLNFKYENNKFYFIIQDSGIGMNEEEVHKLFRLDVHNSKLGTEKEKGTGLGLVLVKEFVEKNNGTIEVESKVGNGSKFTIIFSNQE